MAKVNYRKVYEELTKTKIPKGFEVHHIDFDRNNNDINNLVAIPKGIHKLYHQTLMYNSTKVNIDVRFNPISYKFNLERLTELSICSEIIHHYIFFRDALIEGKTIGITGHNYKTCFKYLTNKIDL